MRKRYLLFRYEGSALIWTLFDYRPAYYNITREGASVKGGTPWKSGTSIHYNIDPKNDPGLTAGNVYNYTIYINDTRGNTAWNCVMVNVTNLVPIAISNEYDVEFTFGDPILDIRWIPSWDNATYNPDDDVYGYTINVNGYLNASGSWDQHGINLSISDWWVGTYIVVCNISINDSDWVIDNVTVTVINDIPTIIHPQDSSYVTGSSGNAIIWTVSDGAYIDPPDRNYTVSCDGAFHSSGTWYEGTPFNVIIDGKTSKMDYNFTIIAYDGLGGTVIDTVLIDVIENDIPILRHPADIFFIEGTPGKEIVWTVKDKYAENNVGTYTIKKNGVVVQSDTWNATNLAQLIKYSFDDYEELEIGNYSFILTVDDGYGGISIDELLVTVEEFIPVVITTLMDRILNMLKPVLQLLFIGYVSYLIIHRRNYNNKKIRLKDAGYQSKKGIKLEKRYDKKSLDQKDELILDDSIRQFKYAIMVDSKLPEPHYNLAIALMEKGQIEQSIAEFRKVIALKPDFAEAHNNLGIALANKGEFNEAIESFKEALKINPEFTAAKTNLEIALEDKDGEYWARFGVQ